MKGFRVYVTIKTKERFPYVIQNRWSINCTGDKSDLNNLLSELKGVKAHVNAELNRHNFALKNCDITIEFDK